MPGWMAVGQRVLRAGSLEVLCPRQLARDVLFCWVESLTSIHEVLDAITSLTKKGGKRK